MRSHALRLLALLSMVGIRAAAWNNGLARTPPMGWSSWNAFHCDVSEQLIKETGDALVSSGLAAKGYHHVNIDDCWAERERKNGRIVPNPKTFPSGMKNLSATLHALSLGLGIYSDAGTRTCQNFPGSFGHEEVDAETFADWGIDFLKLDWCDMETKDPRTIYPRMQKALEAVRDQQPIVFAMCEWGWWNPWDWAAGIANSWRTNMDIADRWLAILRLSETRILHNLWEHSGPGLGWNDADSLEVGVGGLTPAEERSHFALWAFWNSPLILGNDVRKMTPQTLAIVGNEELIAINQVSLFFPDLSLRFPPFHSRSFFKLTLLVTFG
jgi:alpha-galactosidase